MAELVERRRFVLCVRDFPRGCGPPAATVDWKSEETPPPELAARNTVADLPDVEEKSPIIDENMEAEDFANPVGCSECRLVGSPVWGSGSFTAAGVDRDEKADQGMRGSSNQDDKLGPKASSVCGTDGSLKNQCIPWRTAVSAVRYFPIGCGPNAPCMTKQQALKLGAAASSKSKSSAVEDKLPMDQQPVMATSCPTDIEVVEGMKERTEVRNIKEGTGEEDAKEAKGSNSLSYPDIKTLEAENKELLVKKTSLSVPDKRLNEQAIETPEKKFEAQTSRSPDPNRLICYNRLSWRKSTACKVHEIKKRNLSDVTGAAADNDRAKMVRKQHAGNLNINGKRVIIQALMASPNCPWRNGRRSRGSRSVSAKKLKIQSEATTTVVQPLLPKPKTEETASDTQLTI